jgi:hypothetical protein
MDVLSAVATWANGYGGKVNAGGAEYSGGESVSAETKSASAGESQDTAAKVADVAQKSTAVAHVLADAAGGARVRPSALRARDGPI